MKSQSSMWVAVLVVIALVGVVAYGAGSRRVAAATSTNGSVRAGALGAEASRVTPESTEALRRQVAQLQLQVAGLAAQVNSPKLDASAQGAAPAPAEAALTSPEQVEHDRVAWEEHMTAVAADFQAEQRDGRWAQTNASMLQDRATADSVMRGAVKQIECRSTMCRVDMLDDQKGQFGRQLPLFLQSVGPTFPAAQVTTVMNGDGTKTLSVYLSTTTGPDAPGARG